MASELSEFSTAELLHRASNPQQQVGFAEAIAELITRYKSVVYRQALSLSQGNRSFADDVFQETFLDLFEWLSKRKGAPPLHSFASLVLAFSRRAAIDMIRKNRPTGPFVEPAVDPKLEDRLYVMQLIEGMDERSREILRLTYFDGYSALEIAKLLRITAGHVRILRFRAIEALRELQNRDRLVDSVEEL